MRKKIVSPRHRRELALTVVAAGVCSGRAVCRILRLSRSTYWYRGRAPTTAQQQLRQRLRALSDEHPRYGYRRIAALLRQEGWRVGKRQIQRLRRAEGLRVPPTRRKIVRRGVSTGLPVKATHRGHVWTWDFIADATVRGGALRMTEARVVIEDYRHEYNQRRPHSRLGYQSPARFAAQLTPSPSAVGLRPPSVGDGQTQNPGATST